MAVTLHGCAVRSLALDGAADALAQQGQQAEDDLQLAHEASAFYLKVSESLLQERPQHLKLAESVSAGFTQYAYAFVTLEADKREAVSSQQAQQLRERAAKLYRRAQRHAMAALELSSPGFAKALASQDARQWPHLKSEQVGLAYWAAASWGSWIASSKDDPDVVADLPQAIRLATLAWAVTPAWGQGSLASLMGTFESVRPGGSSTQAAVYFDRAIALGGEQNAGAWVARAESLALPAQQREDFEHDLRQALVVCQKFPTLQNQAMQARATWLLSISDDLF